jgi:phage baseplate assembly protein W
MKKDIAAFRFDNQLSSADFFINQGGKELSGKEKAIQDFIIYLFTPRGSVPYKPQYGSYFAKLISNTSIINEVDLFQIFSLSINSYIAEQESDEKILNISLNKVSLIESTIVLNLTFQFNDFQPENIKIPFIVRI